MPKIKVSEIIERPVEEVWAFLSDPAAIPEWFASTQEMEVLTDGGLRKGARVRSVDRFLGRSMEFVSEGRPDAAASLLGAVHTLREEHLAGTGPAFELAWEPDRHGPGTGGAGTGGIRAFLRGRIGKGSRPGDRASGDGLPLIVIRRAPMCRDGTLLHSRSSTCFVSAMIGGIASIAIRMPPAF